MHGVPVRLLALMLIALTPLQARAAIDELALMAPDVSAEPMRVRVLLPPGYADSTLQYPALYLNDGQDLQAVGVEATLRQLHAGHEIEPLIVVAIDVLDDTRDLINGWQAPDGRPRKGLRQLGFSVNPGDAVLPSSSTASLYELDGGRHDQASWARMLPVFLRWAYARQASAGTTNQGAPGVATTSGAIATIRHVAPPHFRTYARW